MKRLPFAIFMALILALPATSMAQKHRHTPRTEQVVNEPDTAGIEAYSDTTFIDTTAAASPTTRHPMNGVDWDDDGTIDEELSLKDIGALLGLGLGGTAIGIFAIIALIVVGLAPIFLILLIVWLIVRNRNQRYRLAEKAMESGQEIPRELVKPEDSDMLRRGIKNIFLGIGIAVMCYCFHVSYLAGIGWLVAICGLGQVVIDKTTRRRE